MKHFLDTSNNQIYSYELDGSQDFVIYRADDSGELTTEFINPNFRPMTDEEFAERGRPSVESQAISIRARRCSLLLSCDWTQMADAPLSEERRAAWRAYRQELRDITAQPCFPDVTWPQSPSNREVFQ